MLKVKFADKEMSFDAPVTVYEAARAAELASREVLAAEIDGKTVALTHLLESDAEVKLLTFADAAGRNVFRHTAGHILAQAVKRLYPETKLTIGPAIEDGFYYDLDSEIPFTPEVLASLESEMKKIVKENLKIERSALPRTEALALMQEKGEPYKVQLIEELPEDAVISF